MTTFLPIYFAHKKPAIMAKAGMQEAMIGIGKGSAEGVGINRRDAENGSVDTDVGVIRIDNSDGEMIAVFMKARLIKWHIRKVQVISEGRMLPCGPHQHI